MPTDPRKDPKVEKLAVELMTLEYPQLQARLRQIGDDDTLGWVRYCLPADADGGKPWQAIVINRWLERDKFFRNVLPQWIGTVFGILSFALAILALIVALR